MTIGGVGMSTATYYSIIRYVPDPVRGEQVNVGALAVHADGTFASVRFDRRFDRARSLGRGADVGFLRDFRNDLEGLAMEQSAAQLPLPARGQRAVAVTIEGKPRLDLDFLKLVLEHQEIRHAAHAISFEGGDRDTLKRDVESTAWLLDDTRKARPNLPLSVLVIERTGSPEMQRAEHICQALDVRFVRTSQVEE